VPLPRTHLVLAAAVVCVVVAAGCTGKSPQVDRPERPRDPVGTVDPPDPVEPVDPEPIEPEPLEPEPARAVVVNDVGLDDATLDALEVELGWAVADGAYWYDPVLGAVGYSGGPTAGFLPAGLVIGGPLAADASAGATGVFVNGRELPFEDLAALEELFATPIPPDYYFLDAEGYYGYEGEAPLGNVFDTVAQQASGGGTLTETAGGWIGGEGTDGYYFDPETGCSVMAGDGVSC